MKEYKICAPFFLGVIFIFLSYEVRSQHSNDFFPLSGQLTSVKLLDAKQNKEVKLPIGDKRFSVFIFLSPECPMCRNYTKTLNELQEKFNPYVSVAGIIAGEAYTIKDITDFGNKYHTNFSLLIDSKKQLTSYLKATVTPEAVLLDSLGNIIYMGAIDDWLSAPGKIKFKASTEYLRDAIEQSVRGERVKTKRTNAVGCKINDY
jgi:thioredoxin-related protein